MDWLSADQFWTGVVRIPRVKPAMLEAVLLHEIGKSYPGTIAVDADLRWEGLDGLLGPRSDALQSFLVQIRLSGESSGLSALQGLVRLARRQKGFKPAALVMLDHAGLEALGRDESGQDCYHSGGIGDMTSILNTLSAGPILCLRREPALRLTNEREVRYLEAANLDMDSLAREPARNDGRGQAVFWRRLAIGGGLACLLLLLAWAGRFYLDRQAQLSELRKQVARMQQQLQLSMADYQERSALEQEIAALERQQPVEIYRLLQSVAEQLKADDRILMVRWDAESQTMSLELASRQAIALLDRLSKASLFVKLASGGMAPLAEDASYLRFTVTGSLGAP